jgi:predicted AlkP superfamily pyrophosphatase or phosphodiesterase
VKHRRIVAWLARVAVFAFLSIGIRAVAEERYVILVAIDGFAAYHLDNEELLLPNIRELIRTGVRAKSSETVYPAVTNPCFATLITGVSPRVHGVLDNGMTDRVTGKSFSTDFKLRSEIVKTTTIFEAAKKKGLKTAALLFPVTRGDPSIDFNMQPLRPPDAPGADPKPWDELRDAGIPIHLASDWDADPHLLGPNGTRDIILAMGAAHVIRTYRPNLLAFYVGATDSAQHVYGPQHYLTKSALTAADYCVGILRKAVQDAGIADRTTFVVVGDHGFTSVNHVVNIYPLLKQNGLEERMKLRGNKWTTFVELQPSFDQARDGAALEKFFQEVSRLEGVAKVVRPEQFHDLGYPRYEEDVHVPGQYLIVANIDTFLIRDPADPSTARRPIARVSNSHGYLGSDPQMEVGLVFSGYRIKEGVRIGRVRNHDVAPTIAGILGVDMGKSEGRVLKEALKD